MQRLGIIPARFDSSRFPGKPLIDINGKSMIRRVYEQATKSTLLDHVIIATDDERIRDHAVDFGAEVRMTSADHISGTDRIIEVCNQLDDDIQIVVNIQGDEPFISPSFLDELITTFDSRPNADIVSAYVRGSQKEANSPDRVKVVCNIQSQALYFSRSLIPYTRKLNEETSSYKLHVGIYAFRKNVLTAIAAMKPTKVELSEGLEQLRWLENGLTISMVETDPGFPGIDTPENLTQALLWMEENNYK